MFEGSQNAKGPSRKYPKEKMITKGSEYQKILPFLKFTPFLSLNLHNIGASSKTYVYVNIYLEPTTGSYEKLTRFNVY